MKHILYIMCAFAVYNVQYGINSYKTLAEPPLPPPLFLKELEKYHLG